MDLVRDVTEEYAADLLALFAGTHWAADRDRAGVGRVLANSDELFGLVDTDSRGDERLVGFARVLTDYAYRATLYDVVVAADRRGEGHGARLLDAVTDAPELAGVEKLYLQCDPEMVAFYERWGFTDDLGSSLTMVRTRDRA